MATRNCHAHSISGDRHASFRCDLHDTSHMSWGKADAVVISLREMSAPALPARSAIKPQESKASINLRRHDWLHSTAEGAKKRRERRVSALQPVQICAPHKEF